MSRGDNYLDTRREEEQQGLLRHKMSDVGPSRLCALVLDWTRENAGQLSEEAPIPKIRWDADEWPHLSEKRVSHVHGGFRSIIEIKNGKVDDDLWISRVPPRGAVFREHIIGGQGGAVFRGVSCYPLRELVALQEERIVPRVIDGEVRWTSITIDVLSASGDEQTVASLLAYLRHRYGAYESLVKQVSRRGAAD